MHVVVQSTIESEYVAITEDVKEIIWLKGLVTEIGLLKKKIVVYYDSQSTIQLCKSIFYDMTKHIDIRFHFIRGIIKNDIIELVKITSEKNHADMDTKYLNLEKV